ncbi:MAG: FAD-linked oxidase C-terminal domain-containing protein [Candidatus Nitrosocaldaceae archaeon]
MFDELEKRIHGDVLYDDLNRFAYASDASSYEILPKCIVLPKDVEDVIATINFAKEHNIQVIARGGGSGLAGQAIGDGIILDFSRYMNEVYVEDKHVYAQPGLYKGMLDKILSKYNKFLPPDPSSSNFCTIGGMIGTNASGAHTVKYGSMIDYVLELEVVLADGSIINAKPIKVDEIDDSKEGKIAKRLLELLKPNMELINSKFPKVSKNSCGYRIDRIIKGDIIDVPKIFVGSEGTLGIVTKAKLKIRDIPSKRVLFLLGFKDTLDAVLNVNNILALKPSALELIDKSVIDLARTSNKEFAKISANINALLFVEFDEYIDEKIKLLLEQKINYEYIEYSLEKDEIDKIWNIRKNALAYTMKIRDNDKKPIALMEDPVVDPSNLSKLINNVKDICNKYSLDYIIYGHAGDGNLHVRPLVDLSKKEQIYASSMFVNDMIESIINLNGIISAEHGDGLARSEFIKNIYGEEIYSLFVKIKDLFDPAYIFNKDKKIISKSIFLNNLRMHRDSKSILNWNIRNDKYKEISGYARELDYAREVELCHGCGACRELNYKSRMCPVYKGLNIEHASCRGRNNVLRWLLRLGEEAVEYDDRFKELIYKYCIECKTCLYECPSNVNVGKIMSEIRARYVKSKGLPKGYKYFVEIDKYAELCSRLDFISNKLMNNKLFRKSMELYTNIDARKRIPRFYRKRFREMYEEYTRGKIYDNYIVFFYDTYINYNNPYLGLKIAKILEKHGYGMHLPKQLSSGLPALLEGAIEKGKEIAAYNIDSLYQYASKGIPIITFSPSATLALKMEYLNVIDNYKSRLVGENTIDIHQFLTKFDNKFNAIDEDIGLHFHCHTLVLGIDRYVKMLLDRIPSLRYHIIEKGCCGTGGSYSFIKDNYDLSMSIGKELFYTIKDEKSIYTTGESCKLQMEEGSGRDVNLTMELISRAYNIDTN